jgi:hypothetical protein
VQTRNAKNFLQIISIKLADTEMETYIKHIEVQRLFQFNWPAARVALKFIYLLKRPLKTYESLTSFAQARAGTEHMPHIARLFFG